MKGLALESSSSKGYKGDIGLIVAIDVKADKLMGLGVTTHNETPGLGETVGHCHRGPANF